MSVSYWPGQMLLASVIFVDQRAPKTRPVLVVHDSGDDDLLVAPVTSHAARSVHDILLNGWSQAGLRLPSVVRLEKLATIEKATVVRILGSVSTSDRTQLKLALQGFLNVLVSSW